MSVDDYLEKRDEIYKSKLTPSLEGMPPWYQRGVKEMQGVLMHPDIMAEVGRLSLCDTDSLFENRGSLIFVFVETYGLSVSYAERLVNFIITKNKVGLQPLVQDAGIHFFSNEKKVAGIITAKTSRKLYDHIQSEYCNERPSTTYLRIGPSSTKEDVMYYVDHFWDKYIKPLREAELHKDKQERTKPKILRDTEVYTLWKHGKSYAEIQKSIDEKHGDFLTDPDLRKIVERNKPKTGILADFSRQFDELYSEVQNTERKLVLATVESTKKDHLFVLKIV